MFSWFRRRARCVLLPYRPTLEELECRDCPAAPVIANFQILYNGQAAVTLTGTVIDEMPAMLRVNFGGVVSGACMTGSNGNFSFTVEDADLGQVTCTTRDSEGLLSNTAAAMIQSAPPAITDFSCVNVVNNIFLITGCIADECAAGLTVTIHNLPGVGSRTVMVQADGTFSLTLECNPVETTISATVTDWWELVSATAYTELIPNNP